MLSENSRQTGVFTKKKVIFQKIVVFFVYALKCGVVSCNIVDATVDVSNKIAEISADVSIEMSKVAYALASCQVINVPDNEQEYTSAVDSLIQCSEDLHLELTSCYYDANARRLENDIEGGSDVSTENGRYEDLLHAISQRHDVVLARVEDVREAVLAYLALVGNAQIPQDGATQGGIVSALEDINAGLDSFLSAYDGQNSKIYTNFAYRDRLHRLMQLLMIWDGRLKSVQDSETSAQTEGWVALCDLRKELSNSYIKLETLLRKFTQLEQTHVRNAVGQYLNCSLTYTIDEEEIPLLDLFAKLEKHDGEGASQIVRGLAFDKGSLTYRIMKLHNDVVYVAGKCGIPVNDLKTRRGK
jgi:hypothetical protein